MLRRIRYVQICTRRAVQLGLERSSMLWQAVYLRGKTVFQMPGIRVPIKGQCRTSCFRLRLNRFKMRHLATYMLLVLGGKASPSKEDVTTALSAVGMDADEERIAQLIADLEGKDINALIEAGKGKLASFGGGGGGGGDGSGGGDAEAPKEEEKKEEEEEDEEIDMGGGMDMFGGGDDGGGGDY